MDLKTQEKYGRQSVAPITVKYGNVSTGKSFLQRCAAIFFATTVCFTGTATAALPGITDVYLKAQPFIKTLPGGETTPMWGFASCPDNLFTGCVLDAPGVQIEAFAGYDLNIHVNNSLSVPVSIVIPGQIGAGNPTFVSDGRARSRVRSFSKEIAPGTTDVYNWSGATLRTGTFLYQSGSHPSIQVPMGLYGALVVHPDTTSPAAISCAADTNTGNAAYDARADSCYKSETTLLLSEIDPVQNTAVATAADVASYPSTINYNPTYLLVNGKGADVGALPAVNKGDTVLLRFLNAGSNTHNPSILGLELGMLAEDGNPYPSTMKYQSVAMLPAGKTLDVLTTMPVTDVTLALYDRMPSFTNSVVSALPGGTSSMGQLQVGAGSPVTTAATAMAIADNYTVIEDTVLTVNAISGVLSNDNSLTNAIVAFAPMDGTLALGIDGSFTYTPHANFSGADHFSYKADDINGNSYVAQVTLDVSFINDAPVAATDTYTNIKGGVFTVAAPGVLGNDADADGDALTAVFDTALGGLPVGSVALNSNGSFTFTAPAGEYDFTYHTVDNSDPTLALSSASVNVHVSIKDASGIVLTVQEPDGTPVTSYRWTLEEDNTWHPNPDASPAPANTLATDFHRSYMPVVAQGCVDSTPGSLNCPTPLTLADIALDPTKHYYVSILPFNAASGLDATGQGGLALGGTPILPGEMAVTANVNRQPMGYAQISAIIFDDNSPTNAAIDGNEKGLGGFTITLEDGGGRYGMSAGLLSKDANGNPLKNYLDCFGTTPAPEGIILTCPDTPENQLKGLVGQVLIKNLYPGKYGLFSAPPANAQNQWVRTSTIEGTKIVDAWVKPNEPAFFAEFGPAGWHVFIGYTSPDKVANYVATNNLVGGNTIRGAVTNNHMSRPPIQKLWDSGTYDALSHTRPWISLNSAGGIGPSYAVVHADLNADGTATFEIPNVPDGSYQLSVWDDYLDQVIAYSGLVTVSNGQIFDLGNVPVFNWFSRLESSVFLDTNENGKRDANEVGVPEVAVNIRWRDGSMYQSMATDGSGEVPFDQVFPFFHWMVAEVDYATRKATGMTTTVDHGGDVSQTGYVLNPQVQADGTTTRTETGTVLTQATQGFLGQTSIIEWGKNNYKQGENGGISGMVFYSATRAEADPRMGFAEPWEPGIPDVTVRLYRQVARGDGSTGLALIDETTTDNWDTSRPTGCPGSSVGDPVSPADKCYDGLRNFNQVRPGVFDGGYGFGRAAGKPDLIPGDYVVEVDVPAGYELVKEEDINVTFGETFGAVSQMIGPFTVPTLPDMATVAEANQLDPGLGSPICVGATHVVPTYLALFPSNMEDAPFAGANRKLCDRKAVTLFDQGQSTADFYVFTSSPIAGHFTGMILDDTAQEFNPNSPAFSEKWAPPYVPVSILDPLGNEISRVYSDQWGRFNGLLPSTFSASMPSPSGFSPAMLMTCMNHPGPIADPNDATGQTMITDPQYNKLYSTFCYTFQYMPGTTTYLDTPVMPVAAFAAGFTPPDCAEVTQTPMIREVNGTGVGPLVAPGGTLTITSLGSTDVPNPAYEGPLGTIQKTINRDFGFGATGTVTLNGSPVLTSGWTNAQITLTIPAGFTPGDYQLVVTRGGKSSTEAITVTVGNETAVHVTDGGSIQTAIDNANPGDLILVGPGVYNEAVIMWKPVRLQGAGAGATIINAVKTPVDKIQQWRDKMDALFTAGVVSKGAAGFGTEEGAGITVLGMNTNDANAPAGAFSQTPSRIDGFSITGADIGGGIFVNNYAHDLVIANNRVFGNNGSYGGGIRIGRPFKQHKGNAPFGLNNNIQIHHNAIVQNGGLGGAGGGVSISTGTDGYNITNNFVCGNFMLGDGGGIAHFGMSDGGLIANNRIVLNQTFSQARTVSGGGLYVGGEPAQAGKSSLGSGDVTVDSNLIQANQSAGGHGGGIRTQFVNGNDVVLNPDSKKKWYKVEITNNMIVNNVAGWSGAGISLQDTLRAVVNNNTIVHNDTTSTVAGGFTNGNVNLSAPQPAGISVEAHSPSLDLLIPADRIKKYGVYSKPVLRNNIIWKNRAFHYDATSGTSKLIPELTQTTIGGCGANANYWDIGVVGAVGVLKPKYSVLTDTTGYHKSNNQGDPDLLAAYCNGGRSAPGPLLPLPAIDEGGNNWIDVRFGPLAVLGDYHIGPLSSAIDGANEDNSPKHDFNNEPRPQPDDDDHFDIGADEVAFVAPDPSTILAFSAISYPITDGGSLLDLGKVNGPVVETLTLTVSHQIVNIGSITIKQKKKKGIFYSIVPGADTCSNTTVAIGGTCTIQIAFTPSGKKGKDREAELKVPLGVFTAELEILGQWKK